MTTSWSPEIEKASTPRGRSKIYSPYGDVWWKFLGYTLRGMLSLGCLTGTAALGQQFTGHISDTSKAQIGKATVRIENQLTGVAISTVSTGSGDYTVPYLTPGVYTIEVVAPGFQKQAKTGITLQVDQIARIDFVLKIGSVAESVTVHDEALLDKDNADLGEVVENQRVTELPLNGRDPSTLAQLSAGVNWFGSKQFTRPFDQTQGALSINGGGEGNTVLMLDGVSNEAGSGNAQVAYIPPVDAVQEFKIVTNPYDARYGRGQGGAIDMTLKSGTNQLHGDVYEFARRTWLDANLWQNAANGLPKPAHKQDQYGFELDGPVFIPKIYDGHNKTFFLLQFENWHEVEPNTVITSVPLQGWINGDFSHTTYFDGNGQQPLTIYDPSTIHLNSSNIYVRDPFPNNQIPQSRIDPIAQKILSYYPAPNHASTPGLNPWTNDFVVPDSSVTIYRNVVAKVDENLTTRDRFTLRYGYWESRGSQNANGLPGPVAQKAPNGTRNETFEADLLHTFTPNLIVDFRSMVDIYTQINLGGVTGFDQTTLGLPGGLVSQYNGLNNYFPSIGLSGFDNMGNTGGNISPDNSYNFDPAVMWVKGHHTFHFGSDIRILQKTNRQVAGGLSLGAGPTWTQRMYNQGDNASGNSIASFLLGVPDSGSVGINTNSFWSQHYYAPFVQDDWKVTPKLTLNIGLRYDWNGPQTERHNRGNFAFDTNAVNPVNAQVSSPTGTLMGGMTFLGVNGNPRAYYSVTKTDIQPRFGFAYSPINNLVFRGGYGMMYRNPIPGDSQYGFSANTSYANSFNNGLTQAPGVRLSENPFPGGILQPAGASGGLETDLGQSIFYVNPRYKTPRFQNFSFGLEQQIHKYDTINITYSGSRSTNQDSSDNINRVSVAALESCDFQFGGAPEHCNSDPDGFLQNPFQNVAAFQGSSYYTAPQVSFSVFSRAFPEFGDITEYQLNGGKSWYNSLQVTATHRWTNSLTLHGTWTWSKTMDSGGFADANYRIPSRTLDGNDVTNRITISGVYLLPVGRGRTFLTHTNRVVDAVLGGWELASLYIYETGHPWSFGGLQYMHDANVPRHSDPQIKNAIRGVSPCVAQYVEQSRGNWSLTPYSEAKGCSTYDFVSIPPYGPQPNIVYSGIRVPNDQQFDANISKNFKLYQRLTAQLRLEGFNVFNHPLFQNGYDGNPNDPQFGTILKANGQSNVPRQVQIALKVLW